MPPPIDLSIDHNANVLRDDDFENEQFFPATLRGYLKNGNIVKDHFKPNNRLLVSNDKPQRLPTLCVWSSARHDRKERSFFGEIGEDKEAPLRARGSGGACQICRENVSGAQRLCCVMIDEDTVLWKGWGNDTRAVKQLAKQNRLTEKEEAAARKEMEKSEKGKSRAMAGTVDDDTLRSTRSAGIGQQKPSGGRRTVRQVGDAGEDKDPGDMGRGL